MMSNRPSRRILILTPCLPYPPIWGSGIRVYQFIRFLAEAHQVSVLTFQEPGEEDKARAIRELGAVLHVVPRPAANGAGKRVAQLSSVFAATSYQRRNVYSREMQSALNRLASSEHYDIVQLESSHVAGFHFDPRSVLILDEHNIEYELLYRMYRSERSTLRRLYNGLEYAKVRREEIGAWRRASGCILTSAREETIVNAIAPGIPTIVGANAVDTDYFCPSTIPVDPDALVMTGLMSYRPNVDGALYFLREIFPRILAVRPATVFYIVGTGATDELRAEAGSNVVVTGAVPDVRPYVHRSAVFVVPLRMGGGTRLKVLEGLAMEKAVVSTSIGCEGIEIVDRKHLLVADSPQAFADAVLAVISDRALAGQLGREGRTLAIARYTWKAVVERLQTFHDELLRRRSSRS
jgi:polysaccharide biosynthesis protein PslH